MRADLIPVLLRRPRVREATWPARKTLLERKLHAGGDFSLFCCLLCAQILGESLAISEDLFK